MRDRATISFLSRNSDSAGLSVNEKNGMRTVFWFLGRLYMVITDPIISYFSAVIFVVLSVTFQLYLRRVRNRHSYEVHPLEELKGYF